MNLKKKEVARLSLGDAEAPPPGFPGSSAGKESACNGGDLSSIPESGRSPGKGIGYPFQYSWASLVAQLVKKKKSTCNAGDLGSIPRLGRSLGKGNSYPLQYSGLEDSMNCMFHGVAESDMTGCLSVTILYAHPAFFLFPSS